MKAHLFGRLMPPFEARRRLLRAMRPIDRVEPIPVGSAFGRVLARTVRAPRDVPSFARATWDGYAVRSDDLWGASPRRPRSLRIVGEVFAEDRFRRRLGPGEAVEIATGGAVPSGADAVEAFERVSAAGGRVTFRAGVARGACIAPAGDDFTRGTVLARPGELLGPARIGAIAASGVPRVSAYARPVVAIVPNGNELRPPGARVGPGAIYESNNAALSAFLTAAGCEPRPRPPVRDDPSAIEHALREALRTSDLVLATGGSSVGERDHLPRVLPRLGRLLFHGIAVRPGKPTLAARAGRKLVIGLPGHPTSCLLNMHWLVLPALHRLARTPGPGWTVRTARLVGSVSAPSPTLTTIVPLRVTDDAVASTFRGSSAIQSLRGAEAFAVVPPRGRPVRPGGRLRVFVLDPPLGPHGASR
jgi:molybdenum cofactor synthesis domain-containing protein